MYTLFLIVKHYIVFLVCNMITVVSEIKQKVRFFRLQLPLTSLRTYDVTHYRFVKHFRILKFQKTKILIFLLLHKLSLLNTFNLKYVSLLLTYLYISLNFV